MIKTIYDLELHEKIYPTDGGGIIGSIIRVPGGWIYNRTVFVPYDNEFQKETEPPKPRKLVYDLSAREFVDANPSISTRLRNILLGYHHKGEYRNTPLDYDISILDKRDFMKSRYAGESCWNELTKLRGY